MTTALPEQVQTPGATSSFGRFSDRFRRAASVPSGRFWVSVGLITAILVFAYVGPYIIGRHDPMDIVGLLYDPPARSMWLGTDNFGRDVMTQLMYGTQTSLEIGVIAGAVATFIGLVIGTIAGFRGGFIEEAMMGVTNVMITIPSIVVLILLSIAVGT